MDLDRLVGPTGIAAGVLFAAAFVAGIPRLQLLRRHGAIGYAACAAALVHSALALSCQIFEPLGVLASVGIIATTVSGMLRPVLFRLHVMLSLLTLVFIILHVWVVIVNA